ncbi:MAG: hypothetical protein WA941_20460 [Nitrososphaeraceae archaeon]
MNIECRWNRWGRFRRGINERHTYFVVAKFSSSSPLSSADAELAIAEALKGLGEDVRPDIVQIGEL